MPGESNTPLATRTTLADQENYNKLYGFAQTTNNPYRKKAIYDYLAAAYRCNLTPAAQQSGDSPIKALETESAQLATSTSLPNKIIVYFAGSGNPVGLKDSLFDEHIIETLSDDNDSNKPIVIAIPGVGINPKNGDLSRWDIKSGRGTAERVQQAYDTIKPYANATNTDQTIDIQIMGHSRGALQAIALGKMLAAENIPSSVMAHDPVMGSKTSPRALNAQLKTTEGAEVSFETTLNCPKTLDRLFVMSRQDENRVTAFKLHDTPAAYQSSASGSYMVNHPGYHNIGVFKGRTTSLNLPIMFSNWYWRPFISFLSRRYNQDLPVIDGHRDGFKAFMYEQYKGLFKAFFSCENDLQDKIKESTERIAQHRFSNELTKNPAYALMQDPDKRKIPEVLVDKTILSRKRVSADSSNPNIYNWNEHADVDDEDEYKANLLSQYNGLVARGNELTTHEQITKENIFAILSVPRPWYAPFSRNYSKEVRALNSEIVEPTQSNVSKVLTYVCSAAGVVSLVGALILFVPAVVPYLVPAAVAIAAVAAAVAGFYYALKWTVPDELKFSADNEQLSNSQPGPTPSSTPASTPPSSPTLMLSRASSPVTSADEPLTLTFTGSKPS